MPQDHESSPANTQGILTAADLDLIMRTAAMNDEDLRMLRMSHDVLADQTDAILEVWYGFVGSQPHLLHYFTHADTGEPIPEYLESVRRRFADWILTTAAAQYDDAWLARQVEIGRRHHRVAKNRTDAVRSVAHIPYRYIVPLIVPITSTLRPFLARHGHTDAEVDAMHAAWLKAVTVQVAIWSLPYCSPGDF